MPTKWVTVEGAERLEAAVREGTGKGGAIICHPHPLYGGSMDNGVVGAIEEGLSRAGLTTLRFNFRGVGGSTGRYDEGVGEVEDALAACRALREMAPPPGRFVLAGYSFGAMVCAKALPECPFATDLLLVAFPPSMGGTEEIRSFSGRVYLVGGSRDDIAPPEALLSLYRDIKTEKYFKAIPCSHFFEGREEEISAFVAECFREEGR